MLRCGQFGRLEAPTTLCGWGTRLPSYWRHAATEDPIRLVRMVNQAVLAMRTQWPSGPRTCTVRALLPANLLHPPDKLAGVGKPLNARLARQPPSPSRQARWGRSASTPQLFRTRPEHYRVRNVEILRGAALAQNDMLREPRLSRKLDTNVKIVVIRDAQ